MAPEAIAPAPVTHDDQNRAEGQDLPDFDPDVNAMRLGTIPWPRFVFHDLGRQTEAVEKAED